MPLLVLVVEPATFVVVLFLGICVAFAIHFAIQAIVHWISDPAQDDSNEFRVTWLQYVLFLAFCLMCIVSVPEALFKRVSFMGFCSWQEFIDTEREIWESDHR